MVTYAQLQSETWWGREIVTPELKQFEQWIRDHFHLPADATGDKGNQAHLNGSHRSDEWIRNSRFCTNRTYTHQAGLTADQQRHIAGCDITPNTVDDMLLMSQRIDRATRAGQLEEVVFWYGNLGGDQRVDGYDNIRNVAATSDSSHLWHLHLSFDRRVLRNINVMRRVFAVLTGTRVDDVELTDQINIPTYEAPASGIGVTLPPAEVLSVSIVLGSTYRRTYLGLKTAEASLAILQAIAKKVDLDPEELQQIEARAKAGAAAAFEEHQADFIAALLAALPPTASANGYSADQVQAAVRAVFADAGQAGDAPTV